MMRRKVEREIERISKYERAWKIQTSEEKFKIISIAQYKTKKVIVNGKEVETCNEGKFLGLTILSTDISSHSRIIKNKGNAVLTKLRRFSNLPTKTKVTLVKSLLMPIMEYPPVPLCTISNTEKHSMQSVINKALRFIDNREEENSRAEELHLKYNITPLNIRIATQAKQI